MIQDEHKEEILKTECTYRMTFWDRYGEPPTQRTGKSLSCFHSTWGRHELENLLPFTMSNLSNMPFDIDATCTKDDILMFEQREKTLKHRATYLNYTIIFIFLSNLLNWLVSSIMRCATQLVDRGLKKVGYRICTHVGRFSV